MMESIKSGRQAGQVSRAVCAGWVVGQLSYACVLIYSIQIYMSVWYIVTIYVVQTVMHSLGHQQLQHSEKLVYLRVLHALHRGISTNITLMVVQTMTETIIMNDNSCSALHQRRSCPQSHVLQPGSQMPISCTSLEVKLSRKRTFNHFSVNTVVW